MVTPFDEGLLEVTGFVDGVEIGSIVTVPERFLVDTALASALAVRGKPNVLQISAMAPNVAGYELACLRSIRYLSQTLLALNVSASLIDTSIETINV